MNNQLSFNSKIVKLQKLNDNYNTNRLANILMESVILTFFFS